MEQAAQSARDTRIEAGADTGKRSNGSGNSGGGNSNNNPVFAAGSDMSHGSVDLDIRLLELPEIQPPPDERLLPSNVIPLKAQA
jgi:hypothetical protein